MIDPAMDLVGKYDMAAALALSFLDCDGWSIRMATKEDMDFHWPYLRITGHFRISWSVSLPFRRKLLSAIQKSRVFPTS